MTNEKPKTLNLDELFGQAKAVKVKHEGREYELMGLDALGPKQAVQVQRMQKKAQILQAQGENLTEEQSLEIDELLGSIIKMLCPEFPIDGLAFQKKMMMIVFYMEQSQGKKVMETALKNLTGPKRSRK